MDPEAIYQTLKSHFAALAKQAAAPPIVVPPNIRETLELVEKKYGEKSFIPEDFDEIAARCTDTQRKGFEKLKPMLESICMYNSFEEMLACPRVTSQTITPPEFPDGVIVISKMLENENTCISLQISPKKTASSDQPVLAGVILDPNLSGATEVQKYDYFYRLILGDEFKLTSEIKSQDHSVQFSLQENSESLTWATLDTSARSKNELVLVSVIYDKSGEFVGFIIGHKTSKGQSDLIVKPEIALFIENSTSGESTCTRWVNIGQQYCYTKGNLIRCFDLKYDKTYQGEGTFDPRKGPIPEGKGVWTQAEPFQRKEGIFKAGELISGVEEFAESIGYFGEKESPIEGFIYKRFVWKACGRTFEGLYDGNTFVGDVTEFKPGHYLYVGQYMEPNTHARGKLWKFSDRTISEGTFFNGDLIDGTRCLLSPEETNLPEREFPDLRVRKVASKYEGPFRDDKPHGYGTYTDFRNNVVTTGTFKQGVLDGNFTDIDLKTGLRVEAFQENGYVGFGNFILLDGNKVEFLQHEGNFCISSTAILLAAKIPSQKLKILSAKEYDKLKMQKEALRAQRAQAAGSESKNPDNKSNMMAGRDWSVSEGSLPGGNYCQAGQSTSLSFGARLPLGFWQMFGFSRAMIVNTPRLQVRPYSTTRLSQGCLQTVLPLRQPVLKMLFRRFK